MTSDPYDYTPVPLKVTRTVRCTYRHVGCGKPMPYQLEDEPKMTRLLAVLFQLRSLTLRLAHSQVGTVLLWVLVAVAALGGIMCLTALRPGR